MLFRVAQAFGQDPWTWRRTHSVRQTLAAAVFLEREYNEPSRTDWQLARISADIYRVKGAKVTDKERLVRFKEADEVKPVPPPTAAAKPPDGRSKADDDKVAAQLATAKWLAAVMPGERGAAIMRQEFGGQQG